MHIPRQGPGRTTARRRWPAVVGALALVLAAGCGSSDSGGAPGPERPGPAVPTASSAGHPNIVFVLTDDLSSDLVQYMPHVQRLMAQGTTFTDYDVADTLCCPSRSTIFTGQFPHDTGVFTNSAPDGGYTVFHDRGDENATFGTALQQAGYRTAMMGKYMNEYQPDTADGESPGGAKGTDDHGGSTGFVPPGWNEWDVAGNGYPEYDYAMNQNGRVHRYGHDPKDYLTDVVSARGQQFIRTHGAAHEPFALEIATFAPHLPSTPAPQDQGALRGLAAPRDPSFNQPDAPTAPTWLRERQPLNATEIDRIDTQYRKRAQSVQAVDRMIGALEDTLVQTGQAENTVLVFNSDNGFHLGQHRLDQGKQTTFTTDLTVPLVMAGAGIPRGRQIPQLTQNVDLAPTFVDLAHAAPLPRADGRSLVPLLAGRNPPDWRRAALVEHHGPNQAPSDPDREPGEGRVNPPSYTAIKTAAGTYTEYATGEREWHDRVTDPYQRDNTVATLSPADLDALHTTVAALGACHGAVACSAAAQPP